MEDNMSTHTKFVLENSSAALGQKLCTQISDRYGVDPRLASEMAWDLLELLAAVDSDLDTLDRYFLAS